MPGARRIEYLPLSSLQGAKSNPKAHDDANIQASVSRFGFVDPPTLDERTGRLVGGHGRRDALLALKAAGSAAPAGIRVERDDWYVPVLRGWASENDAAADAFLLASNQLTMAGGWDEDELAKMLADLSKVPESMAGIGFSEKELVSFLASLGSNEGQCDPDDAPEPEDDTYVKAGDLWRLGDHRLLCGDSTDPCCKERLGVKSAALFYDPPWDAEFPPPEKSPEMLVFTDGRRVGDVVRTFGSPTWEFVWDCGACWYTPNRPLQRMKLALWYGELDRYDANGAHYGEAAEARVVTNSRGSYNYKPDPRGKHLADLFTAQLARMHADGEHKHSKPVDWLRLLIGNCTTGDVFDPFAGSGAALIACEQLHRRCFAIELEPRYCQVIIERWEKFTGQEATCEGAPKVRRARTKPAPEPKPTLALLPAKSDVRTPDAPPSASDVDTDAIPF